ncbi:MAG TPA: DUF4058 domain-containing protein, partial [Gemmataceae bacterium]|nr:DUF4058 domain-containing protein [Gemmataceae bacterium]
MPLLDHFHPPLYPRRDWHSFHNLWAGFIAGSLNAALPDDYFAEPNVQFGIEIDVAAFEEVAADRAGAGFESWDPGPPTVTVAIPLI